jgi:phosphoribosyl-ATP pyrophosphohydrolase
MSAPDGTILDRLYATMLKRRNADPTESYTAKTLAAGTEKLARKMGEEALETMIAGLMGTESDLTHESADLLYHLMLLWVNKGLKPEHIWAELERREGMSGIAEKNSRQS